MPLTGSQGMALFIYLSHWKGNTPMLTVNGAGSMFSLRKTAPSILAQVLSGVIMSVDSPCNVPLSVRSWRRVSPNWPARTRFGIHSLRIFYRPVMIFERCRILWVTRISVPHRFIRMSWNEGAMRLKVRWISWRLEYLANIFLCFNTGSTWPVCGIKLSL